MNPLLKEALHALKNLDATLKPVPLGDAREAALVQGLHGLAAEYGRELKFTRINALGELDFVISKGDNYGVELAKWLDTIPVRTGTHAQTGYNLPEHSWCRINHFDVERLLLRVDQELGSTPVEPQPAPVRAAQSAPGCDGP